MKAVVWQRISSSSHGSFLAMPDILSGYEEIRVYDQRKNYKSDPYIYIYIYILKRLCDQNPAFVFTCEHRRAFAF